MRYLFPCTNPKCRNKFHFTSECPKQSKGGVNKASVQPSNPVLLTPPLGYKSSGNQEAELNVEQEYDYDGIPPTNILEDGTREWRVDGLLHREGAPALIKPNGFKEWRIHGKLDRKDGPAREAPSSKSQWWYEDDVKHREDGPAYIGEGGLYSEWWYKGELIADDIWWKNGEPPTTTIKKLKEAAGE